MIVWSLLVNQFSLFSPCTTNLARLGLKRAKGTESGCASGASPYFVRDLLAVSHEYQEVVSGC